MSRSFPVYVYGASNAISKNGFGLALPANEFTERLSGPDFTMTTSVPILSANVGLKFGKDSCGELSCKSHSENNVSDSGADGAFAGRRKPMDVIWLPAGTALSCEA